MITAVVPFCSVKHHILQLSRGKEYFLILNRDLTLTTVETQLVGPVLSILEAGASSCRSFILLEQQEGKSISLYQYQSKIPIEVGIPMNLRWLADFDTIQDAMAEAGGIKEIMKNNSC